LRLRNDYVIRWSPQFQLHGRYTLGTTALDAAIAATEKQPVSRLKVDKILAELADHDDVDRLRAMLDDDRAWDDYRMADILAVLTDQVVSNKAVATWRSRRAA
jgi:hypothetical protein